MRGARDPGRGPEQLPPGRHGLSREEVADHQRARLLAAMADAVSEKPYPEVSIDDVVKRAGVSRKTFYAHFENKEQAFLVAFDTAVQLVVEHVQRAYEPEDGYVERLQAGLAAFLAFLAAHPEFCRVCFVEVLAAGPGAAERREVALRTFAEMVESNAPETGPAGATHRAVAIEAVIGGVHQVVYARVLRGEAAELPALLPDLLFSMLLATAGPEVAAREHRRLTGHGG